MFRSHRFPLLPLALFCIALFSLGGAPANAEFRIATVDVNRVLNESKEAQAKRSELDKASMAAKKEIETRQAALRELEQKAKSNKDDAKVFRDESREFVEFARSTEEKLREEFMKYNKALTEKTLKIVEAYAKKNSIDLVLDKSERLRGPVLFRAEPFDITDAIVAQVNS